MAEMTLDNVEPILELSDEELDAVAGGHPALIAAVAIGAWYITVGRHL
jgi:hypothetical protein